jgi:hypothetical protein
MGKNGILNLEAIGLDPRLQKTYRYGSIQVPENPDNVTRV